MITPPEIEAYVEAHTTPAPPHIAALHADTLATQTATVMLSGTVEGRFLEMLVWATRPRLVLEIGTYTGSAAQFMAAALPDGGRLITCEFDPDRAAFARKHLGTSPAGARVEVMEGPALETISGLDGPFDLVFIDADKISTSEYFAWALERTRAGGLIIVDNVVRNGAVADPETTDASVRAMRRFFEGLTNETRVTATAVQTVGSKGYDGFAVVRVLDAATETLR
jgi:predicted O-methyltransferase YrrM